MNKGSAQPHHLVNTGHQIIGHLIAETEPVCLVLVQGNGGLTVPLPLVVLYTDFIIFLRKGAGSLSADLYGTVGGGLAVAQFPCHRSVFVPYLNESGHLVSVHTHLIVVVDRVGVDLFPGMIGVFGRVSR